MEVNKINQIQAAKLASNTKQDSSNLDTQSRQDRIGNLRQSLMAGGAEQAKPVDGSANNVAGAEKLDQLVDQGMASVTAKTNQESPSLQKVFSAYNAESKSDNDKVAANFKKEKSLILKA
jgi:hypothetical protein